MLLKDGGQIRDEAVLAEGGKNGDERENTECNTAQSSSHCYSMGLLVGLEDRLFGPVAH